MTHPTSKNVTNAVKRYTMHTDFYGNHVVRMWDNSGETHNKVGDEEYVLAVDYDALTACLTQAEAALRKYGRHAHPNCHDLTLTPEGQLGPRNGCLCGLDDALSDDPPANADDALLCENCDSQEPLQVAVCLDCWNKLAIEVKELRKLQPSVGETSPDEYRVSRRVMNCIYNALQDYGNEATYWPPRTGGVLAGCPRGEPPTPAQLAVNARSVVSLIDCEVLGRSAQETSASEPAQNLLTSSGSALCHWARCHNLRAPGEAFLCSEHAQQRDNGTLPKPDYNASESGASKAPVSVSHWGLHGGAEKAAKQCQHDLQMTGNTIVLTDDNTRAVCVYCSQEWPNPAQKSGELWPTGQR